MTDIPLITGPVRGDDVNKLINSTNAAVRAAGGGGSGTVTSVAVTTANGVSGVVANPTTTPAITVTLGAITPTSVAASGAVSGSNLSGTNTGDQTSVTGNAGTATALQNARLINGASFNGTADISITPVIGVGASGSGTAPAYGDGASAGALGTAIGSGSSAAAGAGTFALGYGATATANKGTLGNSNTTDVTCGDGTAILHANGSALTNLPSPSFRGALVTDSGANTVALTGGNVLNVISWDTESYDTGAIHDNVTNPSRMTIPSGVTKVRALGNVDLSGATPASTATIFVTVNGNPSFSGLNAVVTSYTLSGDDEQVSVVSPIFTVTAGDYVEIQIRHNSAATVTAYPTYGYFSLEIIG